MGHAPRRVEVQKTSRRKGVKIQGGCGVWTTMETQPNRKIGLFFSKWDRSRSGTTNPRKVSQPTERWKWMTMESIMEN